MTAGLDGGNSRRSDEVDRDRAYGYLAWQTVTTGALSVSLKRQTRASVVQVPSAVSGNVGRGSVRDTGRWDDASGVASYVLCPVPRVSGLRSNPRPSA